MKIAFTGSNSTGKTTLLTRLSSSLLIQKYCKTKLLSNAQQISDSMGFSKLDEMSREQQREFQIKYFKSKQESENFCDSFITDRSFVDIAAYWLIRDTWDKAKSEQDFLLYPCETEARKYDILFYFPFGLITFKSDGYRSENMNFQQKIDFKIKYLLDQWKLNYFTISSSDLTQRVQFVLNHITSFSESNKI